MNRDIIRKIEKDFPEPQEIIEMLESIESLNRGPISDRIYRAIVFLSRGDLAELKNYIELAFKDYRDILWQAEYECTETQKYDCNKSFDELGLL